MRCSRCDMPLSPMRTSCPRCGTAYAGGSGEPSGTPVAPVKTSSDTWSPQGGFAGQQGFGPGGVKVGAETSQPRWGAQATPPPPSWDAQGVSTQQTLPPPYQQPTWGSGGKFEGHMQGPAPFSMVGTFRSADAPAPHKGTKPLSPVSQKRESRVGKSSTRLGFTLASLCMVISGLILVFVYFTAQGLPSSGAQYSQSTLGHASPTPPPPGPSPTPPASPTVVLPGQQYIDYAQTATAIDANSGKATQPTTTFKVNQRVYVVFQLHPNGQNGAFCLSWYLNNKKLFDFPFAVTAKDASGYSFAAYTGPGSGYVDIYWASTAACTDKLLAQHVTFTVTL